MNAVCNTKPLYWESDYVHWQRDNPAILAAFRTLKSEKALTGSHFFGGRWENLTVSRNAVPALKPVLRYVQQRAADVLEIKPEQLQTGFWFNETHPGQSTAPHSHDEFDELLSGVYYVQVPRNSGDLCLGEDGLRIRPREGGLVFFDPALVHRVDEHRGKGMRLSIGLNIGPAGGGWPPG